MTIQDFSRKKQENEKIVMSTCYDAAFAAILQQSGVDCLLAGDSAEMVIYGRPDTLQADLESMLRITQALRQGAPKAFIIADMPFLAARQGKYEAVRQAGRLLAAGANAVKIEGLDGLEEVITHLLQSGIPVMGHLGMTPQSFNQFGGFKVQGRDEYAARDIYNQALELERLGCFALVLECVPAQLAADISRQLEIPGIGIGAGNGTDGQVLVLYDLLGLSEKTPRFVRPFLDGRGLVQKALEDYRDAVRDGSFPSEKESYQ